MAISSRILRWQRSIKAAIIFSSACSGFLGSFRQRVVLFFKRFAAQIIERQGGVIAAQAYADGVEAAGFRNDGDSAAAPVEAC